MGHPKIKNGSRVRTTKDSGAKDWCKPRVACWGVTGTVIDHSDSHGLCYLVRYEDAADESWYDPEELEMISEHMPLIVNYIEGRVGEKRGGLKEKYLGKVISPTELVKLASKYDILLLPREKEIKVMIDKKGCRWRQM